MQPREQHDESWSAQREHCESADSAPSSEPRSGEKGAAPGELQRYQDEEIVTKPWPPQRW